MDIRTGIIHETRFSIAKFRDPQGQIAQSLKAGLPIAEAKQFAGDLFLAEECWEGNTGLNEGLQNLIDVAAALGGTNYGSANAYLGVGIGTAAAAAAQTGLQGTATAFAAIDASYPARTSQTVEYRATFGTAAANFAWEEYTLVNAATDAGQNLLRATSTKGTKVAGESWME